MKLVAYLPGADYKVRMEEEIEDEDYLSRPDFYKSTLKDKLIKEFGEGKTKTGQKWTWTFHIKRQVDVDVLEAPKIKIELPEVIELPPEEEIREVTKAYARGARLIGIREYWSEYRELKERGFSPEESRTILRETKRS